MGRPYTADDDRTLLSRAGRQRLDTLARRLGRTPGALRLRLTRHHGWRGGLAPRAEAIRAAGMSRQDVAGVLGVSLTQVARWVQQGLLPEQRTLALRRKYSSIDADDLTAFLQTGGALLDYLAPTDPIWREIVAEARASLAARLICTPELAALLGLALPTLWHLRRQHGMPSPAIPCRGTLPAWYDRAAIRAWLAEHPQYQTTRTMEEL